MRVGIREDFEGMGRGGEIAGLGDKKVTIQPGLLTGDTGGIRAGDCNGALQIGLELPLESVRGMVAVDVVEDQEGGFVSFTPEEEEMPVSPDATLGRGGIDAQIVDPAGL